MKIAENPLPLHHRQIDQVFSPIGEEEEVEEVSKEEVFLDGPIATPEMLFLHSKMNLVLIRALTQFVVPKSTPMKTMQAEIEKHRGISADRSKQYWDRQHKILQNVIRFMIIRHMILKFLEKKAALEYQDKQIMMHKQYFHIALTPA